MNKQRCIHWRKRILEISQLVPAAHVAPAFSCIEIVDALYHDIMRPEDTFVMSKGHGWLAQAAILEGRRELDLSSYCQGGVIGAHPDREIVGASTGSLGHGLGLCVGMAVADRIQRTDRIIYCLLSDGEMQEGSTWEALRFAAEWKLSSLVILVDNNRLAGLEEPYIGQCKGYDYEYAHINGHDAHQIITAIASRKERTAFFLVCETIRATASPSWRTAPSGTIAVPIRKNMPRPWRN